ncbi:hypothetical protein ACLB2K_013879 [Fragaria x ananassa]
MEEVKLFGAWPSPYGYRAIWALELKGVKYGYIEEQWEADLASARFWIKFIDDKALPFAILLMTEGEELEKEVIEVKEILKILEEQGLGEKEFFGGNEIGLADLAIGFIASSFRVIEELAGVKVLNGEEFPGLCNWVKKFKENPAIKKNLPDSDQMFVYYKQKREMLIASRAA